MRHISQTLMVTASLPRQRYGHIVDRERALRLATYQMQADIVPACRRRLYRYFFIYCRTAVVGIGPLGLYAILDANEDGNTWYYSVKSVKYRQSTSSAADDYLFLPPMSLAEKHCRHHALSSSRYSPSQVRFLPP